MRKVNPEVKKAMRQLSADARGPRRRWTIEEFDALGCNLDAEAVCLTAEKMSLADLKRFAARVKTAEFRAILAVEHSHVPSEMLDRLQDAMVRNLEARVRIKIHKAGRLIRVDEEIYQRVKAYAERHGQSVRDVANRAIESIASTEQEEDELNAILSANPKRNEAMHRIMVEAREKADALPLDPVN